LYLPDERMEEHLAGGGHAATYENQFRVHEEYVMHECATQGSDGIVKDSVGYRVAGCSSAQDLFSGNLTAATGGGISA
jgi:hypothetical protein